MDESEIGEMTKVANRLVALLNDAHPGIISWNLAVARCIEELSGDKSDKYIKKDALKTVLDGIDAMDMDDMCTVWWVTGLVREKMEIPEE